MRAHNARRWRHAARIWGLQTDYYDAKGELVKIPLANLKKVLQALAPEGLRGSRVEDIIVSGQERKVRELLSPVLVVQQGVLRGSLFLSAEEDVAELKLTLLQDSGETSVWRPRLTKSRRTYATSRGHFHRWRFEGTVNLTTGYHRLLVEGPRAAESLLLVPPVHSSHPRRQQGVFAPLYALKSAQSWGIGDFRDLREFQKKSRAWGLDFVGTLPLLSMFYEGPNKDISPYSPASKLFWNEIYLHVPDLLEQPPSAAVKKEIQELNSLDWVDYEKVFRLKKAILSRLARRFFSQELPGDYLEFLKEKPLVEDYAAFRGAGDPAEVQYHLFVQYHLHRQMAHLGKNLYLDFPVGVHPAGFDGHYHADSFFRNVNVGAPPDILNTQGQDWGFHPLDPWAIRKNFYEYFIQALRHHMKNATVLRLDHVMALHRLYVIPKNEDAKSGAYLRYHGEELFAIVAIEAHKNAVQVVGENLGTVPERVQHYLLKYEIFGMWLMVFSAGEAPRTAIKKIPPRNLIAFSTHDILPFAGYIKENDVTSWYRDFQTQDPGRLLEQMHRQMAQSPADLFLINLEDLWLEERPQNTPGHSDFRNWRRKLQLSMEEWAQHPEILKALKTTTGLRHRRKTHEHTLEVRRSVSF